MKTRELREAVGKLREFMYGSSYAGPEPGLSGPPSVRMPEIQYLDPDKAAADAKRFRDKGGPKRRKLRILGTWLARST